MGASLKAPSTGSISDWLAAARSVAEEDLTSWAQALRTLVAVLLALAIAFRLDLSSPSSAAVTVIVVSLPQSGMVLEKSFYRLLATIIGALVALLLVGVFAQQRDLFIAMVALWIGVCAALSAYFRNFQSYGWALAGYTACMIGFPAYMSAPHAFDIAVDRVSIVALGVLCGGIVNATLFPNTTATALVRNVRRGFRDFATFANEALNGNNPNKGLHTSQRKFLDDLVALESVRASSYFEDPESRLRSSRLRRFISEFMTASTTAHVVNRLRNDLLSRDMQPVVAALTPIHKNFLDSLQTPGGDLPTMAAEAVVIVEQLTDLHANWPAHTDAARAKLSPADDHLRSELESALIILREFVEETLAFAQTYADLRAPRSELDKSPLTAPVSRADRVATAIAGLRTVCAFTAVCALWIYSSWADGFSAALLCAVACTLFANSPAPTRSVWQMTQGFFLGFIAAIICFTFVLPALDGMLLLAAGLAPFVLLGTYLLARPSTTGIGSGYCLMFLVSLSITSNMQYDVVTLLNNGLAQIVGVIAAAIAFSVLFPTNAGWHARRIERTMWRELSIVRHKEYAEARHRFESGVRDLSLQWINLANDANTAQQRLQTSIVVLETGRALLALRTAAEETANAALTVALRFVFDKTLEVFIDRGAFDQIGRLSADTNQLLAELKAVSPADAEAARTVAALQILSIAIDERKHVANLPLKGDSKEIRHA